MAGEKQKCPMCSTKLKMINGRLTCKSCGYYYRTADQQTNYSSDQYSAGQSNTGQYRTSQYNAGQYGTGQSNAGQYRTGQSNAGQYRTSQSNAGQYRTGQSNAGQYRASQTNAGQTAQKSPSKTKQFWGILGGAAVSVIVSVAVYFVVYYGVDASIDYIGSLFSGDHFDSYEPSPDLPLAASSLYDPSQEGQSPSDDGSGDAVSSGRQPESLFFQALAQVIWEKDYRAISAEEYARLTALEIDREEKAIYYQLDYGETLTLTYESDMGRKYSDLSCFTGLEFLSIDDDLSKGDLDGLYNLQVIYAENSIRDYLEILPNPEKIQALGTEDSLFSDSLEGIDAFPSLQYLSVEYGSLEDISALSQLPNLLGLSLTGCNKLTDFSPLMDLTQLQELSIDSVQLKTIDFISNMPDLTSLTIADSLIPNLDALADCPKITALHLTGNYRIEDFTGLDTLPGLTDLTLELNYSEEMPSFQNLGSLNWLTLKYANDLSLLRNAPNVTYLCLEGCAGWELEAITAMQELTTLEIHDFNSATESLEPLTRLPKLEALDLTGTDIFGSVNEIFGIPTLYYLNLTDCRIALNFDTLPVNETLQCLLLDKVAISDAGADDYDSWNRQTVKLSEHYDMFGHFPNLTDLYLEATEIDSISFVENLPKLQYLDITDNNVTSLKPLASLPDFQTVWCPGNTILETLPEDSSIMVITSRD